MPAVGSGRSAQAALSSSLPAAPLTRNISLATASEPSPRPRTNSSVASNSGVSIGSNP